MSIEQIKLVRQIALPHSERDVLLAMAEHAHDDGTGCWPSVKLLAWEVDRTERQVQRVLRSLQERNLIEPIGNPRGGRGRTTEYHLHLERGELRPPCRESRTIKGDISSQSRTIKGDILEQKGDILVHKEAVKGDVTVSPFTRIEETERVTFSTIKGDILELKGDILELKGDIAMSPEPSLKVKRTVREPSLTTAPQAAAAARGGGREPVPEVIDKFETFYSEFMLLYPARDGKRVGITTAAKQAARKLKPRDYDAVIGAVSRYAASGRKPVDPVRFFKSTEYPQGMWREWLEDVEEVAPIGARSNGNGWHGHGNGDRDREGRTGAGGRGGLAAYGGGGGVGGAGRETAAAKTTRLLNGLAADALRKVEDADSDRLLNPGPRAPGGG